MIWLKDRVDYHCQNWVLLCYTKISRKRKIARLLFHNNLDEIITIHTRHTDPNRRPLRYRAPI